MAKKPRLPFIGWSWQKTVSVFVMVAVVVAVIFRVEPVRRFVTGS